MLVDLENKKKRNSDTSNFQFRRWFYEQLDPFIGITIYIIIVETRTFFLNNFKKFFLLLEIIILQLL